MLGITRGAMMPQPPCHFERSREIYLTFFLPRCGILVAFMSVKYYDDIREQIFRSWSIKGGTNGSNKKAHRQIGPAGN